jgi:hypothetical protein
MSSFAISPCLLHWLAFDKKFGFTYVRDPIRECMTAKEAYITKLTAGIYVLYEHGSMVLKRSSLHKVGIFP